MKTDLSVLFQPKTFEHEVRGQTLEFVPNKVSLLVKLRPFISTIAAAIATFSIPDNETDTGSETITEYDKTGKTMLHKGSPIPLTVRRVEKLNGLEPQIAQLRDNQRKAAIENVIATMTSEKNHKVVAELVIDSLRNDESFRNMKAAELVPNLDVELLTGFVTGLLGANMEALKKNADPLLRGLHGQSPALTPLDSVEPQEEIQPVTSGAGSQ